ncbi:hypothetical protein TEA_015339 [Camellia sinensis var. sinensis]|uniref:G domain-containing protein n=1 Tax=Camellia sinensis var. sinensis TaxID=542762 RepID=A0A4S4F2D0_CAMSN|nr:hypothetical protein TEA_015339 [Camellia sinensis var. sinensis]
MYRYLDRMWEAWDNHVLSAQRRSTPVRQPWECVPGYMDWYKNITHLYVEHTDEPRIHEHQNFNEHADRIALALQISHPIIDASYQEGIRHPYRLYQAIETLRALRTFTILSSSIPTKTHLNSTVLCRFYASQPQQHNPTPTASEDDENGDSVFDSSEYTLPNIGLDSGPEIAPKPTWDENYRAKANRAIFGEETQIQNSRILVKEEEKRRRAAALAKALLEAALERPDEEEEEEEDVVVKEEDQKSLSVGIIGAPNAGKSALTNYMVAVLLLEESDPFDFYDIGVVSMK